MKLIRLFFLCTISFSIKTNAEQQNPQNDPNPEIDRLWKRYNEQEAASALLKNSISENGKQIEISKKVNPDEKQTTSSIKYKHENLDPELRALVLDLAPSPVKRLAENIKNYAQNLGNYSMPSSAIFTGIPGSGKTTLVQAIAEDANIDFILLKAPYTADKFKNSGSEKLREFFDIFMNVEKPTLVAIDEFHRYTDGYKKINEPDPGTAETFWLLMDDCKKNKNLIIIGITNDTSEMAPQIESRFGKRIYEIKPSNENIFRQRVLHHCLSKNKVPNSCDQKCEKTIANLIEINDVRIIQDIVISASDIASERKDKITQKDLAESVKEYEATKKLTTAKEDQMTKTLKAQERAANASTIASYTTATVVGGGAAIAAGVAAHQKVQKDYGSWEEAFKKWGTRVLYLGIVAGKIYIGGRVPSFQEFAKEIAANQIKNDAKGHTDYEQK